MKRSYLICLQIFKGESLLLLVLKVVLEKLLQKSLVDKSRCNVSDIFYVDDNPNIALVIEKVKEIHDYRVQ